MILLKGLSEKNLRLIGEVTGSEPEMKNESGGEKIQERDISSETRFAFSGDFRS